MGKCIGIGFPRASEDRFLFLGSFSGVMARSGHPATQSVTSFEGATSTTLRVEVVPGCCDP